MQKKFTNISLLSSKSTIHKATALRLFASVLPVKCKFRTQWNTRKCNCIKNNVKCIQYCHTGHLKFGNLPDLLAEQTEIFLVFLTQKLADPPKYKRLALTPTSKSAKKRFFVDQTISSATFAKVQGLQPPISTSIATRSESNKFLAEYPNTAGVIAQLQSLRL